MKKGDLSKTERRRQAELLLIERKKKTGTLPMTRADTLRLVHELEVHQIQLEMQNEELIQARAEAEAAYRQYTDLYDFAPVGYFTLASDSTIRDVNLAGANLLAVERSLLVRRRFRAFVSAQSRPAFNAFFEKLLTCQGKETCELSLLKNGNELFWIHIEASCFEAGQESRAIVSDITARKQTEEQLRLQSAAINAAANAIIITDRGGTIEWINPAFTILTGYTATEAAGKNLFELIKSGDQDMAVYKDLWDTILAGNVWHGELINRRKDGSTYNEEQTITPLRDGNGRITHFIAVKQDITTRKLTDEALIHLSTHDALTGLYNRGFFVEEIARLERGRRFPVSIVMADVDHLKKTNDQEGHAAGDALLQRVAQILTAAFRSGDVVARIGGDEFAVLLPSTDANAAKVSLQRLQQVIQENNAGRTGTPIHISLGMSTAENPGPLSNVLKEADMNMYREKQGRDALE